MDIDDLFPYFILGMLASVAIFIILMGVGGWKGSAIARECLRLGYRDASVEWLGYGNGYCIQRRDQTDVVVPLAEARAVGRLR